MSAVPCSNVDGRGSCLLGGCGASQVWRPATPAGLSDSHWVCTHAYCDAVVQCCCTCMPSLQACMPPRYLLEQSRHCGCLVSLVTSHPVRRAPYSARYFYACQSFDNEQRVNGLLYKVDETTPGRAVVVLRAILCQFCCFHSKTRFIGFAQFRSLNCQGFCQVS